MLRDPPCPDRPQTWGIVDAAVKALQFYAKKQALFNDRLPVEIRKDPAIATLLKTLRKQKASMFLRCVPVTSRVARACGVEFGSKKINGVFSLPTHPGIAWTCRRTPSPRHTHAKVRYLAHFPRAAFGISKTS